jgi:hypothetical protein
MKPYIILIALAVMLAFPFFRCDAGTAYGCTASNDISSSETHGALLDVTGVSRVSTYDRVSRETIHMETVAQRGILQAPARNIIGLVGRTGCGVARGAVTLLADRRIGSRIRDRRSGGGCCTNTSRRTDTSTTTESTGPSCTTGTCPYAQPICPAQKPEPPKPAPNTKADNERCPIEIRFGTFVETLWPTG